MCKIYLNRHTKNQYIYLWITCTSDESTIQNYPQGGYNLSHNILGSTPRTTYPFMDAYYVPGCQKYEWLVN